jgi:hypothetical protein
MVLSYASGLLPDLQKARLVAMCQHMHRCLVGGSSTCISALTCAQRRLTRTPGTCLVDKCPIL